MGALGEGKLAAQSGAARPGFRRSFDRRPPKYHPALPNNLLTSANIKPANFWEFSSVDNWT